MPMFRHSSYTVFNEDGTSDGMCIVRLEGPDIVVEYEEDGRVTYKGYEVSEGHYELTSPSADGTATLHRFRDAVILEGSYKEGGYRGMWMIELSDEE